MNALLLSFANELGFERVYLLKPVPYPHLAARRAAVTLHKNAARLVADPTAAYPWANAVALLVLPYRPYAKGLGVSGYYPASNRAYHAANRLLDALAAAGVRAERAELPIRETLLMHGLGIACQNGLTAVPPFGTRAVFQSLVLDLPDAAYTPDGPYGGPDGARQCAGCGLCAKACPAGAITERGLGFTRCIRAYMEGGDMPEAVMDAMTSLLGCELCQYACPLNREVPEEPTLPDAFGLSRLLSGDTAGALALIGKNMKSGGRLEQHAAIMAGKQGRADLLPLLDRLAEDARAPVAHAAAYARKWLRKSAE